jgi:hypothetical protein
MFDGVEVLAPLKFSVHDLRGRPGRSPACSPLAVLTRVECCGQHPFQTPPEPEIVRFGGAALQVYRMACASCGTAHRRYFRTRAPLSASE